MFKKKKEKNFRLETNVNELKKLVNEFKSLVARTENKQAELRETMCELESLTKLTDNKLNEINRFKWKHKIRKGN